MPRQPYEGTHRRLVIAFDVGTTFSGISYCIQDPGIVSEIKGVNRFPAQEHVGGDSKIPSILWYDRAGNVRAVGAEALDESNIERAEDEFWTKVEWFKMHLRPKALLATHIRDSDIPPLPPNKTPIQVFADFLKYLLSCAHKYIEEFHLGGADLLKSVRDRTEYVLTHPNGWEGAQQGQMRRAAVLAGLIPDTPEGQAKIRMVTEGEASLHYCITSGSSLEMQMQVGQGIIVIDAGGGTVDLSAYRLRALPNEFEEIAAPQCRLQGSIFVSQRANRYLENLLYGTRYGNPEEIKNMTQCFDSTTKLRFRNQAEPSFVRFGTMRDSDPSVGIRSGQLKIPGVEVAAMFEPSVLAIIESVTEQIADANYPVQNIFLVGGFAASDWLFSRIRESLRTFKFNFCRPDSHINKAVADGAIAFFLDHNVTSRVSRWTYGIEMLAPYDSRQAHLRARKSKLIIWPSGRQFIPHQFSVILKKGSLVSEETEFRKEYRFDRRRPEDLRSISVKVLCYRGAQDPAPGWTDEEPGAFPLCCTIQADTRRMASFLVQKQSNSGKTTFFSQRFDVILAFGLTELKAQVSWMENGAEVRGPASVIYD